MQKVVRVLVSIMPSDPPEKTKRDDEAQPREDKTPNDDKDKIQPADKKTPEGEGNLRRRAEWFQKRTGQT